MKPLRKRLPHRRTARIEGEGLWDQAVIVRQQQVTVVEGHLIAAASDLELPPGRWPEFIGVVDEQMEGRLFQKEQPIVHGGEFAGYVYATRVGSRQELRLFND